MGLLSALGGLVGLAFGGPIGAALGSGIGTLASGGDMGDALKSGIMGYGIGSLAPGLQAKMAGVMGLQGSTAANALATGMQGASGGMGATAGKAAGSLGRALSGIEGGLSKALEGDIMGISKQNLALSALMKATEPKPPELTDLQKKQRATGERLPDYQGTAVSTPFSYTPNTTASRGGIAAYAMGGHIQGPGTGTSDSIPAMIYQNGGPVQQARLSDGEFVMTADAVRGAGGGNRNAGAARMYQMMNQFERMA